MRCSRYAFGPNRLHYCGPDRNSQMLEQIKDDVVDVELMEILSKFETLYPYLCHIAEANHINNPLDDRVVEAYWIGNTLLDRVDRHVFYRHLVENLRLKDKLGSKSFSVIEDKISYGALPHHSFHVFDVWKRNGDSEHTLEDMDQCRVSWGEIIRIGGPFIEAKVAPLMFECNTLVFGAPVVRSYVRQLESDYEIEQLKPGDHISIHWGVICEKLTLRQVANLRKYTLHHLALANQTL